MFSLDGSISMFKLVERDFFEMLFELLFIWRCIGIGGVGFFFRILFLLWFLVFSFFCFDKWFGKFFGMILLYIELFWFVFEFLFILVILVWEWELIDGKLDCVFVFGNFFCDFEGFLKCLIGLFVWWFIKWMFLVLVVVLFCIFVGNVVICFESSVLFFSLYCSFFDFEEFFKLSIWFNNVSFVLVDLDFDYRFIFGGRGGGDIVLEEFVIIIFFFSEVGCWVDILVKEFVFGKKEIVIVWFGGFKIIFLFLCMTFLRNDFFFFGFCVEGKVFWVDDIIFFCLFDVWDVYCFILEGW